MSARSLEQRREESARVWAGIRKRIEDLDRAAGQPPEAEDLAALWHRRALELAEAPDRDREEGELLTIVIVRLGPDRYGLPITAVREIQRVAKITPVQTAPAFVRGVINLRGVIVTVVDLRVFFGLDPAPVGETARILTAECGAGAPVGLLVEQVEGIVDLPAGEVKPPLGPAKGVAEDYVAGIAAPDGQMMVLIDLEKVLRNPRIVVDESV